jgi:DNA-directed RNA polymerase specialized sigma24 family protein
MNSGQINAETGEEIESVVSEFERPLLRYAWWIMGDDDLAQDMVRDVFLRFFRKCRRGRTGLSAADAAGELYRAVDRACLCRITKNRRTHRGSLGKVMEGLLDLDLAERQAVILAVMEKRNAEDIGKITGLSSDEIDALLGRGLLKLSNKLGKAGIL